ncbi:acetyltransferase (GNAT) family protein [Micromonospora sp. M71_S20]|uniref:GNAT family N-acetyltransferase n=1 Tax=Micromonospora sp. M71_S20 TaxID=592872 RepID=UPI000F0E99A5|nr:GNAT family N-acetyltransferase [Micromonospora sp. M71_S20]RLK09837.1 acetyltransferase (GNAT) family protein [Micromonospora sp. M71_S20]
MAIGLRVADNRDVSFLVQADLHVDRMELHRVIEVGRVTVAVEDTSIQGWLRWGLFWDEIPFMNMLFVLEQHRGKGLGTRLIQHWENQQRTAGHGSVMTSTLASEEAQHLYRRLGYVDRGCLLLPGEPLEILLAKSLEE